MTTKASALHLVGIFAEAEMRAESMATSMFLSCMLSQSLDAYEDTKKQYQDALASDADEQELTSSKHLILTCLIFVFL